MCIRAILLVVSGENMKLLCGFHSNTNVALPLCSTEPFAIRRGGEHGGSEDWEQDGEGPAVPLGDRTG